MSLFYKAVAGQMRTVYDLLSFLSFRRSDDVDEQFETIDVCGKPIPTSTSTTTTEPIFEQKVYTLRPRKPVNYVS